MVQIQPYSGCYTHLSVCLFAVVYLSISLSVSLPKLSLRFSLGNCLASTVCLLLFDTALRKVRQTNRLNKKHSKQTMRYLVGPAADSRTIGKYMLDEQRITQTDLNTRMYDRISSNSQRKQLNFINDIYAICTRFLQRLHYPQHEQPFTARCYSSEFSHNQLNNPQKIHHLKRQY